MGKSKKAVERRVEPMVLWSVEFRSRTKLDGLTKYLIRESGVPVLFRSRAQACRFVDAKYGYLRGRDDLRNEPFGWMLPRPVRVTITQNNRI